MFHQCGKSAIRAATCYRRSSILLFNGQKGLFRNQSSSPVQEEVNKNDKNKNSNSLIPNGPGLEHFIANPNKSQVRKRPLKVTPSEDHPYLDQESLSGYGRKVYFDVYGCQMNENDTEVVWSILHQHGYDRTENPVEADLWLVVTCSIREGAEAKVWKKLVHIQRKKKALDYRRTLKVGVLGCMAERLKDKLLQEDKLVDVVAGPDSYRDLPRLFAITTTNNQSSINVLLSLEETYADVMPMRLNTDQVTGFVSIQRGCDNMCSYCIVPFTRGKERSRPVSSILDEVKHLSESGVKEVTLLGQNVNSYIDTSKESIMLWGGLDRLEKTRNSDGFKTIYKSKSGGVRFADLLEKVSEVDPEMRVRFTSPHPKDFPDEVLKVISERTNICNNIHLPAQSGNTRILEQMRRGYSREAYLDLVNHIRDIIPEVTFSSDFIVGFCGETDKEFEDTLSLIKLVKYHKLFLFPYSLREKTHAHRHLEDNVPNEIKSSRHLEIHRIFREEAEKIYQNYVGKEQLVLIEGDSKRSSDDFQGRNDAGIKVIFPKKSHLQNSEEESSEKIAANPGDFCLVKVDSANSQVLKGQMIRPTKLSSIYDQ